MQSYFNLIHFVTKFNTILEAIKENLYNYTLCMDARHINSKHFNVHGAYSHFMISATERYIMKCFFLKLSVFFC